MNAKNATTGKVFSFRINTKNLFLTYPMSDPDKKIFLDKEIIRKNLKEKMGHRGIKTLIVSREISDGEYEHLHAVVFLDKKINITSPDFLDINGIHGSYERVKNKAKALDYVTKDGDYISEGYDPELTTLGKFKDPFKNFTYACSFKGSDPEKLLQRVLNFEEEEYNEYLFDMFNDYIRHKENYHTFVNMKREENTQKIK